MPQVAERKLIDQPHTIPGLLARGEITPAQVPNPHWRADACAACHRGTPSTKNAALGERDVNRLCNHCHEAISDHAYIHPVGMTVDSAMRARMAASFRDTLARTNGRVSCVTCHDLPMQCLPQRAQEKPLNPLFFRGGPYRSRTDICFRCHEANDYERLNPHEQRTPAGEIKEASCLICHDDVAKLKKPVAHGEAGFNVRGDLNAMCTGCHPWVPHPGGAFSFTRSGKGPDHLAAPAREMRKRMDTMARRHDIVLPLDPNTGKVYCATCHNPHARGVMRTAAADRGADSKHRLRMADLCLNCHEK